MTIVAVAMLRQSGALGASTCRIDFSVGLWHVGDLGAEKHEQQPWGAAISKQGEFKTGLPSNGSGERRAV